MTHRNLPLLDSVELTDEEAPFELEPAHGIDTPERRLEAWALCCKYGATNVLTVEGVSYSWDARPRRLKNGAVEGRVYAQRGGEHQRDIGGYKIAADGAVVRIPAPLRGALPGANQAEESDDRKTEGDHDDC